jgi:ABC-2 type transport system ATP-binding protein
MHSTPAALSMGALCKSFDGKPAVDQLELTIQPGEFYALLGPNGAGKTTTIRMAAGLLLPDSGSIEIYGVDVVREPLAAKRMTAWLPDEPALYDKLDPLEYLEFVAGLWGVEPALAMSRARELMEVLELWPHRHTRCEGFSRGMKQKLALAGALIHEPRLLILDEPLTGLDAAAARSVKDILLEQVAAGGTVILTTHILEVAERIAQRIGIIRAGKLVAEGSMAELSAGRAEGTTLEQLFLELAQEDIPA